MSKRPQQRPPERSPERPQPAPSRLGRGLGNLIPVPAQRPSAPASSTQAKDVEPFRAQATDRAAAQPAASPPHASVSETALDARASASPSAGSPPPATSPGAPDVDGIRARSAHEPSITFVPLVALRPGKFQPRGRMDPAALEALAASIATSGLMQPLVVRPIVGAPGVYEVIAGERRWRALERLGRTEAPAIVRSVPDQEAAELSLVENLQREDLNPMDRAAALQRLVEEFALTHQDLAARIGLDRATITNLLRLNTLDNETASHVRDGSLTAGHAKVLAGIADVSRRCGLAALAVQGGWSVRQLEREATERSDVPRGTSKAKSDAATGSAHLHRLERELQEHLGTRVRIQLGRKKGVGELRIQFFSLDEFDGLMQRIGFQGEDSRLRV